jgi:hypothetical protein
VRTAGTHNKLKYVTGGGGGGVVVVVAAAAAANSLFARFNFISKTLLISFCPRSVPTFKYCTLDDSEGRVYKNMEENGRGMF